MEWIQLIPSFWGIRPRDETLELADGFQMSVRVYEPQHQVGPDMFIVHGLGAAPAGYDLALSRLARDYKARVVAPTLPNHGRSGDLVGPGSFQRTVDLLIETLLHPRLCLGPVLVVGHSLGAGFAAVVTLRLKREMPERLHCDSVVMLMTPTGSDSIDARPVDPFTAATRLSLLVPDTMITWCQAIGASIISGRWAQYLANLEVFVTHPFRPIPAVRLLLDAPPINGVINELHAEGVCVRLVFAVFDPAIPFPVRLWWSGLADAAFGTHGSVVVGLGPTYWALRQAINRALGIQVTRKELMPAS